MLVADTLDAVSAESVVQKRRALQGFAGHDFGLWKVFFKKIAAGNGAAGPCI